MLLFALFFHTIQMNFGQRDFYRVKYSEEMMSHLIKGVKDKSLPPADRLGLQNDLFNLVCTCIQNRNVELESLRSKGFFKLFC